MNLLLHPQIRIEVNIRIWIRILRISKPSIYFLFLSSTLSPFLHGVESVFTTIAFTVDFYKTISAISCFFAFFLFEFSSIRIARGSDVPVVVAPVCSCSMCRIIRFFLRYINFTLELTEKSVQFISVWSVCCSIVLSPFSDFINTIFFLFFSASFVVAVLVMNILRIVVLNLKQPRYYVCEWKRNWRRYTQCQRPQSQGRARRSKNHRQK